MKEKKGQTVEIVYSRRNIEIANGSATARVAVYRLPDGMQALAYVVMMDNEITKDDIVLYPNGRLHHTQRVVNHAVSETRQRTPLDTLYVLQKLQWNLTQPCDQPVLDLVDQIDEKLDFIRFNSAGDKVLQNPES